MSAGALQGKHLGSKGPTFETLPDLSGSFIAGCVATGFFSAPHKVCRAASFELRRIVTLGSLLDPRIESRRLHCAQFGADAIEQASLAAFAAPPGYR